MFAAGDLSSAAEGKTKFSIDNFEIVRELGRGSYGKVVYAIEKSNNYPVALKMMEKAKFDTEKSLRQLCRELELQYHLKHRNILRLHAFFSDAQTIYMVLEACRSESVFHLLYCNPNGLPIPHVAFIVDSVANALIYCHQYNIIHRDLKPENILFDVMGTPKLADFGFCVRVIGPDRDTMHGTVEYVSPEMTDNDSHHRHNYKVDVWAVGILLYELLNGQSPFYAKDTMAIFAKIQKCIIPESEKVPDWAMQLIRKLLKKKPEDRMELGQFCADVCLRDAVANWFELAKNRH